MSKKQVKLVRSALFGRFIHVVGLNKEQPVHRVQAVSDNGKMITTKCNPEIYQRVLGEQRTDKPTNFHLGLRQLSRVKFRAHFDVDEVLQALDIIPNRLFTSGAAPRSAGRATKSGFDVHWDESLQGYDVWTEHPETGDPERIAYAGMSEKMLLDTLDDLRAFNWGTRKTATVGAHRFDKLDDMVFKIRPVVDPKYVT